MGLFNSKRNQEKQEKQRQEKQQKAFEQNMQLKNIAMSEAEYEEREAAVAKLRDQCSLEEIAKFERENNEGSGDLFANYAIFEADLFIRIRAIEKLAIQSVLEEIASNETNNEVLTAVILKLNNLEFVENIAENHESIVIKGVARDRAIELKIQQEDLRKKAVSEMTDQRELADIAENSNDMHIQNIALEKLTDQSILTEIAKNPQSKIRGFVISKLNDQKIIGAIAINDENVGIRKSAISSLTQVQILVGLAKNDNLVDIQQAAVFQLANLAKKQPKLLLNNWENIKQIVNKHKHKDNSAERRHEDSLSASDCHHTDNPATAKSHQDIGIRVNFPEYPPKL